MPRIYFKVFPLAQKYLEKFRFYNVYYLLIILPQGAQDITQSSQSAISKPFNSIILCVLCG
jgi:fructosamine-3-kinase